LFVYGFPYKMASMSKSANEIIAAFGGIRGMQEATGIPLMTIRTWAANGVIVPRKTSQHAATILRAAQDRGIDLKADDLIDTEVPA